MRHKIGLNTLGGSFCKRCHHWSNLPDGLEDEECEKQTQKETVRTWFNREIIKTRNFIRRLIK